ncbi:MAG TPA: hypothetical protein VLU24_14170 [Mycobacterium sp.]|nr:hypothetical protein [Mycobacterium sp.]
MQLALTDDEAKFRDQLREFYPTEIPEEIRERVRLIRGRWPGARTRCWPANT